MEIIIVQNDIIDTVLLYIDDKDITITALARSLGLSREHLSRVLNKKTPLSRRMKNRLNKFIYGYSNNIK